MRQGPSGGPATCVGIQGTIGGSEGRTPGSPAPPPGGTMPAGAATPQVLSGSKGSGLTARSWIVNSGATSTEAGCPVSLQSVIGATSAGRAQSTGFLLP